LPLSFKGEGDTRVRLISVLTKNAVLIVGEGDKGDRVREATPLFGSGPYAPPKIIDPISGLTKYDII